jgi:outer membrane protein TolC
MFFYKGLRSFLPLFILFLQPMSALTDSKTDRLPEPLTLKAILALATDDHPDIARKSAELALAEADLSDAQAQNDASLDLSLQGRYIDPAKTAFNQENNDAHATLIFHKMLYDFGRSSENERAGEMRVVSYEKRLQLAKIQKKIKIMRRYFDVLLADLEFAVADEANSIRFVRFDNAKERHELGEISDIEILALENEYQRQRLKRQRSENQQRQARVRLALAINRPDQLSAELEIPVLPGNRTPLPDYKQLLKDARKNNLNLRALDDALMSLKSTHKAAKSERLPKLYIQLEAAEYEREFGARDPFTAILGLDVPLYQGGRTHSLEAKLSAQIMALKARRQSADYHLRQDILETWQTINTLLLQTEQAEVLGDYRDLYLDRSRAHYELELEADLGDAMTKQSEARLFTAQTDFELAIARETLVELTGNPTYSAFATSSTPPTDMEPP